jgi:hypothetical protein
MQKPKYANYAELAAAFKSGELDQHYYMMLDKGGADASLCYHNPKLSDVENDRKSDECSKLFRPEYSDHIFDLYQALGIRAEWC